ncbi:response regulator transcription factor [Jeotgalibacillus sp. R-1-5s-1]|uniref:response regulator transcription factor n=1 Tax=Jeotgalibacillus sp. R-1-5s-1 TaxID=2555897 RepID=UPI00106BAA47|nr:response regulator transcription factor [Jeotgalibacillus sp. R-1-5s-1]TFD99563.1 response regulator transcription factor [Jeotgalibacillus sp. R-1-5s-1]
MEHKVLLVEDNRDISELVERQLIRENLKVTRAFDGEEALRLAGSQRFDVIILDLMIPKVDGIEVLKTVRLSDMTPVLILSAKDSDIDKTLGLGFGADDYLSKPFSMIELTARVKALIRRASYYEKQQERSRMADDLEIFPDSYSVKRGNEVIQLTLKEFTILQLLYRNQHKIYTKEELYERVWGEPYFGDANVINVHMRRLREKIEADPADPKLIKTIWGIGYKWGDSHSD